MVSFFDPIFQKEIFAMEINAALTAITTVFQIAIGVASFALWQTRG